MTQLQVKCCQIAKNTVIVLLLFQLALESRYSFGYLTFLSHPSRLG